MFGGKRNINSLGLQYREKYRGGTEITQVPRERFRTIDGPTDTEGGKTRGTTVPVFHDTNRKGTTPASKTAWSLQ